MADDGTSYYEPGAGRSLARKFELQAYDLRDYLKKFEEKTGEEAITDGFGVLTESEEVTSAYIAYSADVASAVTGKVRRVGGWGGWMGGHVRFDRWRCEWPSLFVYADSPTRKDRSCSRSCAGAVPARCATGAS